jgi:ABC-2 type transport system ATP-binding protein
MSAQNKLVEIEGLNKWFGGIHALRNVDFEIAPGTIVGLLGDNGAGKSTLIRHMVGMYLSDEGVCRTLGSPPDKLSPDQMRQIGYVHQQGHLIDWMNVRQHLNYVRAYYPGWNCQLESDYIEKFEINTRQVVGNMSPGEKQKLAILIAIGYEPCFLILDEPASALDPIARSGFLEMLLEMITVKQCSILISSHILSDVEKIMDRTVIMRKGKIICDMDFDSLRELYKRVRFTPINGNFLDQLRIDNMIEIKRDERQALCVVKGYEEHDLEQIGVRMNCEVDISTPGIEDVYRFVINENKGL